MAIPGKAILLAVAGVAWLGLSQPAAADVTSGLFSRYSFDVDARDNVGSNNGTLSNGAAIVTDPVRGNVVGLDGVDDYVALPMNNMASGRSELTMTVWVKPSEWVAGRMLYDEAGGSIGEYWQFSMTGAQWYTRDSSTGPMGGRNNDIAVPNVPLGEWHHLAFVYSVSAASKAVYYDGAPYSSSSTSVDQLTTDRTGAGLGFSGDSRNFRLFGRADELRFYSRALTPSEIADLASATAYTLTVNSGSGDGTYAAGIIVNITADPAPTGLGFSQWTGDVAGVANTHAPVTTITMPASNVVVTAMYSTAYTLTVNSGSGDGMFAAGAVVPVLADDPPSGYSFYRWTGSVAAVANVNNAATTVTMPAGNVTITATYQVYVGLYLTVNSGSGDGAYTPGQVIAVLADPAPSGMEFNMWIGDIDGFPTVTAKTSPSANYTMPATSATITATYIPAGTPKNWWPVFDMFCKEKFGATKEELVYQTFGATLSLIAGGEWTYASKNSATVAFQTNLPAKSYVQYGTTMAYGNQVTASDRYLYTHIIHLTGLADTTTYHYRLVAEDEVGNILNSPDKTLTTATPANVILIPGGVSGPTYNLNQAGRTYLVTQDLVIDGKAFDVSASNVTLDLGGHTVTYDNAHMGTISGDFWAYINTSSFGIRAMSVSGLKVYNGTLKQGAGADAAESSSIGFNPIYTNGCSGMDIAGLTIEYNGPQQVGIYNHWGGNNSLFHHNVFLDTATEILNRHGAGSDAILMYGSSSYSGVQTYNNLILRVRQSGLSGNTVHDNEIYMDSWATNSFGVSVAAGGVAYNNKVFGTGYHVVAFGWTSNLTYHHNFVHLEGEPTDGRFTEFGDQISLNGFRLTQYSGSSNIYANNHYYNNVVIVTAVGQSECRGAQFFSDTYVSNLVFENNIIKALVRDNQAFQAACIVTQGLPERTDQQLPIYYLNNTLISNICQIRFGDYYGVGSNSRFHDSTFIKVGSDPDYKTFLWDSYYPCKYNVIRDPVFQGGASLDSIDLGEGDHSMTVEWTLTVQTDPNADVTIRNSSSQVVFTGNAGAGGSVSTPLAAYKAANSGAANYTPHTVTASLGGNNRTVGVTMDAKKTIQVYLNSRVLTVNSGSGSGLYQVGQVVPVSADSPASGKLFTGWVGGTAYLANPQSAGTTVTMPAADVAVTATYGSAYQLTVNSGTGDGLYLAGTVVGVTADAPPSGYAFDNWTGDVGGLADVNAASTTYTMPAASCVITAAYAVTELPGDLNDDGFVGQGDLNIVLSQWGKGGAEITDPRADANHDNFVGQGDLNIVLAHWGERR